MASSDIKPNINGHQHAWADIRVNILGRTLTGITGIDYDDDEDSEFYHGAGQHVVAFGNGNIKATCKIKIYKYELDALIRSAKAKGIQRLQDVDFFDIVVTYKETKDASEVTDIVRNCKFKKVPKGAKSGDTKLEADIDLICSHIDWNE
jgi:hypothetical protein